MDEKQIKTNINEASHKADDWVENAAEKHNFPKWKVWAGIAVFIGLASAIVYLIF